MSFLNPKRMVASTIGTETPVAFLLDKENLYFQTSVAIKIFKRRNTGSLGSIFSFDDHIIRMDLFHGYLVILVKDLRKQERKVLIVDKQSYEVVKRIQASGFSICRAYKEKVLCVFDSRKILLYDHQLKEASLELIKEIQEIYNYILSKMDSVSIRMIIEQDYVSILADSLQSKLYLFSRRERFMEDTRGIEIRPHFEIAGIKKFFMLPNALILLFSDRKFRIMLGPGFIEGILELPQVEDFDMDQERGILWVLSKRVLFRVDTKTWEYRELKRVEEGLKGHSSFKQFVAIQGLIVCTLKNGLLLVEEKTGKSRLIEGRYVLKGADPIARELYVYSDFYLWKLALNASLDKISLSKVLLMKMWLGPTTFDNQFVYLTNHYEELQILDFQNSCLRKPLRWPPRKMHALVRIHRFLAAKDYLIVNYDSTIELYKKDDFILLTRTRIKNPPTNDMQVQGKTLFVLDSEGGHLFAYSLPSLELFHTISVVDLIRELPDSDYTFDDIIVLFWVDRDFLYLKLRSDRIVVIDYKKNWSIVAELNQGYKELHSVVHSNDNYLIYFHDRKLRIYTKRNASFKLVKEVIFSNLNTWSVALFEEFLLANDGRNRIAFFKISDLLKNNVQPVKVLVSPSKTVDDLRYYLQNFPLQSTDKLHYFSQVDSFYLVTNLAISVLKKVKSLDDGEMVYGEPWVSPMKIKEMDDYVAYILDQ